MPESHSPDTGGESNGCAPDARANDWLDLGANTKDDSPMTRRVERKEQLNVWLAGDLRFQRRKGTDARVSPLLLVILGPDFESTAPRQKSEKLPAPKSTTRARIADENPRVSSTRNQRGRKSGKTLRRVRDQRPENGADQSSPPR